ncbi:pyridoxamine 5'-phosphate oxidase family protein [Streptomyces aureus]|uniref:pyridoxamine 5'-phosphate oxidase family protein n=1 Tax=Streptomyces aureus TaxID=193461 RepID=UPI000562103A|nr:pyridoxamine 5'-phosphate oxidase family protein [Streptomyces aureus]
MNPDTPTPSRRTLELAPAEALHLLSTVSLGRIVFTQHALPAIRPVNHIVLGGDIIVRTHHGAALAAHIQDSPAPGVVVAYEADVIDPGTHTGWSVVATGYASLVTDPAELEHYQQRLQPWVDQAMDLAVRIHPEVVTGIRLTNTARR